MVIEPKVSVIIPVYNTEKYLRECLDSIAGQTLREIEIICIDDGSTDNSLAVLREYERTDERFVILSQENKKQASARNAGLDRAGGKYIYFMDSDDILKKTALEELYDFSERESADIVFFNGEILYECDASNQNKYNMPEDYYKRVHDYSKISDGPTLFANMMSNKEFRCSPCMQMISAEHISACKLRFYEGIYYEDELFAFLCIMQANRTACIDKSYYIRRQHPGSTTNIRKGFPRFQGLLLGYINVQSFLSGKSYSAEIQMQTDNYLEYLKNGIKKAYAQSDEYESLLKNLSFKERRYAKQILREPEYKSSAEDIKSRLIRHLPALLLCAGILFLSIYMVWWGTQKEGYFVDEMYSMMIIRGGGLDRPYNYADFFNTWHIASELESTIGVAQENVFSGFRLSRGVYWNLLHFVYSLTPGQFSVWPSLLLNLVFYICTLIVIHKISKIFIENEYLALLPVFLWGISSAAVNMVLFIRFYTFKTLICTLLVYVVLKALSKGFGNWRYLFSIVLLIGIGAITHQYFFVFAFFLAAFVCLYLLISKRFKPLIVFAGTAVAGIAGYQLITGASIFRMITNPGGGLFGRHIVNLVQGTNDFPERVREYADYISQLVFGGVDMIVIVLITLILSVMICITYAKDKAGLKDLLQNKKVHIWLLLCATCGCYALTIARICTQIAFYNQRYMFCITPLIMVLFVSLLVNALKAIGFKRTITVLPVIAILGTALLLRGFSDINIYRGDKTVNDTLQEYHHLPVICVSYTKANTGHFYWQLFEFEDETLFAVSGEMDFDSINSRVFKDGMLLIVEYRGGKTLVDMDDFTEATGLNGYTLVSSLPDRFRDFHYYYVH